MSMILLLKICMYSEPEGINERNFAPMKAGIERIPNLQESSKSVIEKQSYSKNGLQNLIFIIMSMILLLKMCISSEPAEFNERNFAQMKAGVERIPNLQESSKSVIEKQSYSKNGLQNLIFIIMSMILLLK